MKEGCPVLHTCSSLSASGGFPEADHGFQQELGSTPGCLWSDVAMNVNGESPQKWLEDIDPHVNDVHHFGSPNEQFTAVRAKAGRITKKQLAGACEHLGGLKSMVCVVCLTVCVCVTSLKQAGRLGCSSC